MGAPDNPKLTRHVRVAPSTESFPPLTFITPGAAPVPANSHQPVAVRLAGVIAWAALYDGGELIPRSETYPPPAGEWAMGPDGFPYLSSPPIFTLTADVIGTDLPPYHVFRPDELSAWTLKNVAGRMMDQGFVRLFPDWATKPPQSPIEQMTAAIAQATAAGQYDAAAKMSEALTSMAKVAAQGSAGETADQPANRHQRRAQSRDKRR